MIRVVLAVTVLILLVTHPVRSQDYYDSFLQQVHNELLIGETRASVKSLQTIDQAIAAYLETKDSNDLLLARDGFRQLVRHWKSVEAVYLAGVLDDEYLDHPRMIDHFNQGNESLEDLLDRALASEKNLKRALFKTSTKSINAMDYLLFAELEDSERRWQAVLISSAHMQDWLTEVLDFYQSDKSFIAGGNRSLEMVINALLDSSFRLVNWRTGEPAGLVEKTQGKPSADELEYLYSGYSIEAIDAIINTHARIFELADSSGLFSEQGRNLGLSEVAFSRTKISEAQELLGDIPRQLADPANQQFQALFKATEAVHNAYYFLLVDALNLQGKIVDADGD